MLYVLLHLQQPLSFEQVVRLYAMENYQYKKNENTFIVKRFSRLSLIDIKHMRQTTEICVRIKCVDMGELRIHTI